jgi:putative phosphoesterase
LSSHRPGDYTGSRRRKFMKWMIASDIHGSAYYCRKLLEAYTEEGADRLLLLGDILYHGPRNDLPRDYVPKEVIALLNERKNDIYCVRGNCDTEVDQMVLEFPVLSDYCVLAEGTQAIYATHGHIYNEQKLPPLHSGDILLHGHTHVPKCVVHETEQYICMNPGSVSIPKEESWHGYMIWEGKNFVWKDFDGQEHLRYSV